MKTKIALERKLIGKFFKIKSRTVLCKKIYDFNSINDFKMNGIAFHQVTGIIDSNYEATCNYDTLIHYSFKNEEEKIKFKNDLLKRLNKSFKEIIEDIEKLAK